VKGGNEASATVFLRMGFTETTSTQGGRSIAILSDRASWMNNYIQELLLDWLTAGHRVLWVHDKQELRPGDFCFYLSCGQIVPASILSQFRHNLVVHESDLPRGKGWSPLTWQILQGENEIPVTLFEAGEKVDSGVIYSQDWMEFKGHELIDELREAQARVTMKLCKRFVDDYPRILEDAREQVGASDYYPRRLPTDSLINPDKLSISELFALLRVADPDRYPIYFNKFNHMYKINLEKCTK
jgi:methionyl-tRNA formyltransferase